MNQKLIPSREAMVALLRASQIHLNAEQLSQLWAYHNLMREHNKTRELTRIIDFRMVVIKHYVDSIIIGKWVSMESPVLDLGTGAGFPGIPLKIRYPHLKFILAEPRPKRIEFLNLVVSRLGLKNTSVFEHKVVSQSFQTPVKTVITRAVESIDKTLLRISGCLEKGGTAIFMKGPNLQDELEVAHRRLGPTYQLLQDHAYQLPGTPFRRRLIVYERKSAPA